MTEEVGSIIRILKALGRHFTGVMTALSSLVWSCLGSRDRLGKIILEVCKFFIIIFYQVVSLSLGITYPRFGLYYIINVYI
jgi:hypothetical protein